MSLTPYLCSVHTHATLCDGKSTLEEMAAAGEALRVSCQFCGEEYAFTPEEVLKLRRAEKEN